MRLAIFITDMSELLQNGKTSTLMYAAGTVQQFSGGNGLPAAQSAFFYGDNPVDQANVLWGINMYYNR